ncbi:conserved hypothetical protein [Talaromyces stipitatus ATCC 10500]|uniref:GPI anchored protein n=1 Tax=Talaromyces stipitatus (strain ATCC 10500 / CBS 375.48 / QM 6759 / NRRL 1006) TaxID=441959 RepID=B8MB19_TALSN|nr:uncharacterized protein TSTA_124440 [Talaromyces stipitatus ATCC 10500]EED18720.1 conserved hypothetical protein [Talaromyces stipitatus ATCC 10500]
MLSRTIFRALIALEAAATLALAQTNITADVCADPSAFTSCTTQALATSKGCTDMCNGSKMCVLGCGCAMYQSYINCVAESCWNQAYSCEYDKLVAAYFSQCSTAAEPIPFWPAPDSAPGGCSCNLGKVLQSVTKAQQEYNTCITNDTSTSVIQQGNQNTACGCCEVSAGLSAMYETCPDTIPADMGADIWLQASTIYGTVIHWDKCGSVLDQYNCHNLGFAPPSSNSSTFYKPANLPPNGTLTLYNTGPANAVTAPPSGSVFTWSQSSVMYTVTASPWKNGQIMVTSTSIATTKTSSTVTGTSSTVPPGATSAATGTAKTGAAMSMKELSLVGPAAWLQVIGVLMLV